MLLFLFFVFVIVFLVAPRTITGPVIVPVVGTFVGCLTWGLAMGLGYTAFAASTLVGFVCASIAVLELGMMLYDMFGS